MYFEWKEFVCSSEVTSATRRIEAHFCLVVEPGGLNDAKKAIEDAGVPIDIEARRWGARGYADSFYFQSPEEVQIELREYPN